MKPCLLALALAAATPPLLFASVPVQAANAAPNRAANQSLADYHYVLHISDMDPSKQELGANTFAKMTDASVTLNYLPGARIRAGLIKTPGAEEGLQAIHVFDYINFTEATNALLNERFPNKAFTNSTGVSNTTNTGNIAAQTEAQLQGGASLDAFTSPVGAFRDVGVQVFDAFDMGSDWALSYAAMVGNGSGVEFKNSDGKYDKDLYLSAEKKYGGKGPRMEGLKLFAWGQWGERLLDITDDLASNPNTYKRDRAGLGVKYMKKPFRATAEYIAADGMIF